MAPFRNIASAHKNETCTKNRWTVGRASSSGVSGQKSCVKRCVKGLPTMAEHNRTAEARNVLAVGWMKSRKALPVTKEMTVRSVSSMVPSSRRVDTRRRTSRRATMTYDQASVPSSAPRNPAITSRQ